MAKLHTLFILVSSLTLIIFAGTGESTISTSVLAEMARVYVQGFLSGPNATLYEVARASIMHGPPSKLRVGQGGERLYDERARLDHGDAGPGRGLIVFSGRAEAAALLHLVLLFEHGTYKGSSLSLLGRARMVEDTTEEVPIVGGTGQFRAARGYPVPHMHSFDHVTGYLVYIYDLHVYRDHQEYYFVN